MRSDCPQHPGMAYEISPGMLWCGICRREFPDLGPCCQTCGRPIAQAPVGRRRRFCGTTCRVASWRKGRRRATP